MSGPLTAVPGHINAVTGLFCTTEGTLAPGGRCPDGCDHADHYANDGHPECEDLSGEPGRRCPSCRCNVASGHVPGSADCDDARIERLVSQADE